MCRIMKIIFGTISFLLAALFSNLNAQENYDYLSCENCASCDTIVTEKKLQKTIQINCSYPNGKIRSEFRINEKMKKTDGVREKWAWYSVNKVTAMYYSELGELEKKEWWKNGKLKKKK